MKRYGRKAMNNKTGTSSKRNKHRKLKLFNFLVLFAIAYFIFTIAKQELKMRDINAEIVAANAEFSELKQEEQLINKKIEKAADTKMVENKAKSVLGWVGKNEFKVIEQR